MAVGSGGQWPAVREEWSGGTGICAGVQLRRRAGAVLLPQCLWLMALCGPEALVVLCVLHHRRILETGKEVAGIHGFLGGGSCGHGTPAHT